MRRDFDEVMEELRNGTLNVKHWNFCYSRMDGQYRAYIMGEGAEQCLASKDGFENKEAVAELFKTLGVTYIFPI